MKLKAKIIAIIAVIVVAAGVLGLVACGKKPSESETTSVSVSASDVTSESAREPESAESPSETESESAAEHVHSGGTATCLKKAVCDECGEEYGELAAHSFTAETAEAKYLASAATCENAAAYYKSCAVCGEKGEETFESGEALGLIYGEWVSNGDGTHTRTCVNGCNHTETEDCSGGGATCTAKAICETCKTAYGETKAHNYVEKATSANLASAATCTRGAVYYKSCSVCGVKSSATFVSGSGLGHNLGNAVTNNDGTHTKKCTRGGCNHSVTEDCSGGTATCTALAECSACGGKYGSLENHDYTAEKAEAKYLANAATCENAAVYYKSCAVCGEKGEETFESGEALGLKYGEWVSNGDGTHTRTCVNGCNHSVTEDCSGGAATCTEKAICENCGTAYGAEPSHSWNEGEIEKEAACTENGVKTYTCGKCTATKKEDISATGHSYSEEVVEPTCLEKGYTKRVCQNGCGEEYEDDYKDALGHDWDKDAVTCTEGRRCKGCEANEPAIGHDYIENTTEATCTEAAVKTTTCSRCNYKEEEEIGLPKGHTAVADDSKTVLQNGKTSCYYIKGYKCSVCEADLTEEKNGEFETHDYVASIVSSATCMKAGKKNLTCNDCGHIDTATISIDPVNGHNWNEGVKEGDYITYTCQNVDENGEKCGETKKVFDASTKKEATVSKDNVAGADGEVHLDGAEMKLDDTVKDQLGENVTVGADTLDEATVAGLNLTEEQKKQIGNNNIYNFKLESDGAGVDFNGGKVKVTLPYTLASGEDVDSIAVWYITESGEIKSYKATYFEVDGKGYVTFDAEHFSYYTVTRLTPEERCALYGHSYKQIDIAKTCTTDGYKLVVCVRCGYEEIRGEEKAEGHKYEVTTKNATCTANGSAVYVCSVCSQSYRETILATGHKWKLGEESEATCKAAGYKKFVCENDGCDGTYTVTSAKLSHDIKVTEVAPTCETAGYTEYKCENCDYGYKKITADAKGHKYNPVWAWGEDYSATLKMVCANDETHEITVNVTVETLEEEATCVHPKRTVYRASGEFNGIVYVDEKSVTEGETVDHVYSDYIAAADRHYKKCDVCGAEAESGEHSGTREVIKTATCAVSGEAVTVCDTCGYVKKEIIPATGEHYYVKGVCAYCGKVYGACDHTELKFKYIDLGELGACEGMKMPVLACECGEKVVYDVNYSGAAIITCNIFDESEVSYEDGKTAEGNEYEKSTETCLVCGCEYETYAEYVIVNKCTEKYIGYVKASKNGKVIFNAVIEQVNSYHENTEVVEKDIRDFVDGNVCNGSLVYKKCLDCGEEELYNVDLDCEISYDLDNAKEEITVDEDGFTHRSRYNECKKCGLRIAEVVIYKKINECVSVVVQKAVVSVGGKVIVEMLYDYGATPAEHDEEVVSVKMNGYDCEDGWSALMRCKNCGTFESISSYGHKYGKEKTVTLPEGSCGGAITYRECIICGSIDERYGNIDIKCDGLSDSEPEVSKETIDGVEYEVLTWTCKKCGLRLVTKTFLKQHNECVTERVSINQVLFNDEVVVTLSEKYFTKNHDYETTYELDEGETCESSYKIINTCKVCGETKTSHGYGHVRNYRTVELTGECGGVVEIRYCEICGVIEDYSWRYSGNHQVTYSSDTYTDDDGIEHEVTTETCSVCGIKEVTDVKRVLEDETNCGWRIYTTKTLSYADGTVIASYEGDYYTTNHEYEYSYAMKGETCEDGYTVTRTCKICGATDSYEDEGHVKKYFDIEIEGNPCEGIIGYRKCVVCGEVYEADAYGNHSFIGEQNQVYTDDNGYEHTVTKKTCETCGVSVTDDCWYAPNPNGELCSYLDYSNRKIANEAGEILAEGTWYYTTTIHKYVYEYTFDNGEDCSGGYSYVATCSVCGETDSGYGSYHYWTSRDVELNGECGGRIEITYCRICEKVSNFDIYGNHEFGDYTSSNTTDENGIVHNIETRICTVCGIKYIEDNWRALIGENPCEWNVYRKCSAVMETETLAECVIKNTSYEHIWVYNFTLTGETCEDGWTAQLTCAICGKDGGETSGRWHYNELVEYYDLSENGACDGTRIRVYKCACGYRGNIDWDLCSNGSWGDYDEIPPKDGELSHAKQTFLCSDCGLKIEKDVVRVKTSDSEAHTCIITTTETYNVSVNGVGICNLTNEYRDTNEHVYSSYDDVCALKEGLTTCDDGIIVTRTCSDCGYTYTYESTSHRNFLKESFALNSVCGGTAYIMSCACGYSENVGYVSECEFDETGVDIWIENTVHGEQYCGFHNFEYLGWDAWIRTCAVTDPDRCAYKIRYAYYWLKNDDCSVTSYSVWQFGYNEQTDTFDREVKLTGETKIWHDFEETSDYDETNIIYTWTYTCKDCGSYYKKVQKEYESGRIAEVTLEAVSNLENDSFKTHNEVTRYDENGNRTFTCEWTDNEGNVYSSWKRITTTEIDVPAPFESGYKTITETESSINEYRYGLYKIHGDNYEFALYEYNEEKGEDGAVTYWYKYEYTYDFASCTKTCVYTNSRGERNESSETHFGDRVFTTVKDPTCTQCGTDRWCCSLCGYVFEEYQTNPNGHNWRYVSDELYVCSVCGLMNKNGADGLIVMEDLTDYENGEYYEVGYWFKDDTKQFIKNVTLVRKNALGDDNDEILLDMADEDFLEGLNGIVSVRFLKSRAEELAQAKLDELGLSREDYNVRFSFVPRGFKDTLDYAITFEPILSSYQTSGDGMFVCKIVDGTAEIIITSTEEQNVSMKSIVNNGDTYATLYDSDGNELMYDDDGAGDRNFLIEYVFEANKTYKLVVRWYNNDPDGYIPVVISGL